MQRIVIFGNAGAGKSTLARQLAREHGLAHLDLDTLAWQPDVPPQRRPLAQSARGIRAFTAQHPAWVVEGCYSDLLELALPDCTELVFLNPGVEACIAHCRARPWEPHKYASKAEQDANLALLLDWVRQYETRDDELSLRSHRRLYDGFAGLKRELQGEVLSGPEFFEHEPTHQAYQARRASGKAPNEQLEQPAFDELVGEVRAMDVCELGCGDGRYGRALIERGCHAYRGVDASSRMVAAARQALDGMGALVTQERIEQLELADESFDLVLSRMTLHWIEDLAPLFARLYRALRPRGRLVFSVEHPVLTSCDVAREEGQGRTRWVVDDYFVSGPRVSHWFGARVQKYHRSIEQYFQLLRANDFRVDDLREATPSARHIADPAELRRRQRVPVLLLLAAHRASPGHPPQISRMP
ncbi:MAG: methyltransferase domain-containing protein [Deltaproteobacteria bacterium]